MLKISILFLLWILAFLPILPEWILYCINSSNDSYCLLVPFISLYLIWQKRKQIHKINPSPSNIGLFIIVLSLIAYIIFYAGHIAFISRCMMIVSLIGLVIFNFGMELFSQIKFPLLFLFFMVPLPKSFVTLISFPLKLFATRLSAFALTLLGIPVHYEGTILSLCNTQIEIAEACSGLRFLISFIMIGTFFLSQLKKIVSRLAIAASIIPIAILSNILRIAGIAILTCVFGNKIQREYPHELFGIIVFLFGLFLLFVEFIYVKKKVET